jgi:hypothetical protein
MPSREHEEYLGDGLYASFDGWQVVLRAPRETGDHFVALEPAILARLVEFISGLRERFPGQPVAVWEALNEEAKSQADDR